MIQVSMSGVAVRASPRGLAALKSRFRLRRVVRLPGLVESSLLDRLSARLEKCAYRDMPWRDHDRREIPSDPSVSAETLFFFNDRALFGFIESVTGCREIAGVSGGVFRSTSSGHRLSWHDDVDAVDGNVVAALAVHLGRRAFRGGRFQIKFRSERRIHAQLAYRRPGEGLLMAVGSDLVHRSTPVVGRAPKLVFTCFFHGRSRL